LLMGETRESLIEDQIDEYESREDENQEEEKESIQSSQKQDSKSFDQKQLQNFGEDELEFLQNTPFVERLRLLQSYLQFVYPSASPLRLTSIQNLGIAAGLLGDRIKDFFNVAKVKAGLTFQKNLSDQRAYQFQEYCDKKLQKDNENIKENEKRKEKIEKEKEEKKEKIEKEKEEKKEKIEKENEEKKEKIEKENEEK
ncbi:MAG: hypothetical protein EZS28_055558, partial [Streblomastix strix]